MLGNHQHKHFEGSLARAVMTNQERDLILKIRAQQTLGTGMFVNDEEFVQWALDEYSLTREQLTQLAKESI